MTSVKNNATQNLKLIEHTYMQPIVDFIYDSLNDQQVTTQKGKKEKIKCQRYAYIML
jgi:hypothetical protein